LCQKPRSKWKAPDGDKTPEEIMALHRTWMVTVPKIRECSAAVVNLQHAANQLAHKTGKFRRGERWEHVDVMRVSVAKRE
jgi:hypothetical protein